MLRISAQETVTDSVATESLAQLDSIARLDSIDQLEQLEQIDSLEHVLDSIAPQIPYYQLLLIELNLLIWIRL